MCNTLTTDTCGFSTVVFQPFCSISNHFEIISVTDDELLQTSAQGGEQKTSNTRTAE